MAEKTFLIVNRRSDKALQATGLDNGLVVEQSDITYTDAQLWSALENDSNVILINKASSKVLDVMKNGTLNGTWAQTWENVGSDSQLWTITETSNGYKKIANKMSGKVLDIQNISDLNGAVAQLWDDVGGENQEWEFVVYPKAARKKSTKTVEKKAPAKKPAAKKAEKAAVPEVKAEPETKAKPKTAKPTAKKTKTK